jgi:hypothetical protein
MEKKAMNEPEQGLREWFEDNYEWLKRVVIVTCGMQ